MMYIGKKMFRGMGKKNKNQQSNWRVYTGSSKFLQEEIEIYGKENFEFYVIEQYYTKGGWSWAEIWSQVTMETPSNNDMWYNKLIEKCSWKVTEPPTLLHRDRLQELVRRGYLIARGN